MIKPRKLDTDVHVNEPLQAPPEPIICWFDSACPTSKQVRQARTPRAWLFILICVAIAGGLGMAEWHHNRAATNARAQSLSEHANWETLRIAHLEAKRLSAAVTQSASSSTSPAISGQTSQCALASVRLCPEDELFRELPELMTSPDSDQRPSKRSDAVP